MADNLRILAFDTSGNSCAAAVLEGDRILAAEQQLMERGQAERLVPMIETVLETAKLSHDQLDALAVTTGPGAFTGVRIGLATARGYGLALGLPQIGASSLEVLAAATTPAERRDRALLILIDAKRRDFFAQLFDENLIPMGNPFSASSETLVAQLPAMPLLITGSGCDQAEPALDRHPFDIRRSAAPSYCQAVILARLAATRYSTNNGKTQPAPLYLRSPDVTLPPKDPRKTEK
ncbi:tRNA (adenosine(37)-N6)-threonylcarbamoyltransferase complex dimerization subunit type 1 TsaB [Limibacillus sp. MBR-115]|jgi:tRNA threonylcarbamoyladenosine biosynthesis protein TsaB|uniref:tRNA (adenosine(37)-N6)-threonylcarbamoyltransferase complex dimerization subunit type 1 TsaB n=1 Tax=Limibacillus sp. MBR-115 TaxID=3156465 RepID=UPI003395303A